MILHDLPTVPQRVRFTVNDFLVLDRSGAFADYAKTELLDGEILVVNAQYSRHARAQRALFLALAAGCRAADDTLEVLFEISVDLDPTSMPQPDLVVARAVPDDGPLPLTSVALIVEVADSSLPFDLGDKADLYAGADIPEYWVVDLAGCIVHQLWGPRDGRYAERHRQAFGSTLLGVTLPIAVELPDVTA